MVVAVTNKVLYNAGELLWPPSCKGGFLMQENINIVSLLASDNFIVINRGLLKRYGLNVTLMLCELASEYNYYNNEGKLEEDGMFFSTIENISDKTGLSRYQQAEALKVLEQMGIVKTIVKGVPAKRYFKLDVKELANKLANNLPTSLQKTDKLDVKKLATNNNNIKIINKNNNKNKEREGDKENENSNSNQEMEMVYQHYLDRFGTTAGRYKLTDKRRAKLKSRLQDCGADMLIDAIDHARADYFYNGDNDRGWKADLDFILRSYENVEKLANLTPRQRKLTWQEKKEQEEQAEFDRKFGEPKYVYEPCNLEEGSYELLGGTSAPDEPTREPFSEDFIEQMRQRAFGGKNKKEAKNDN